MVVTRKKVGVMIIVLTLCLFGCVGEEDVRGRHATHEEDDDVNVRHAQKTQDVCDDGKTGIAVDLQDIKFECEDEKYYPVYDEMSPSRSNCSRPKEPLHKCMRDTITYTQRIPHSGMHRPKWARYGTYRYLPPQRWLHNIEHGAVVALYDPCAPRVQVDVLKQTVRRCLRKHIITPYTQLTQTYPFALSAWGCTMEMAHINVTEVQGWIVEHALQSGEESTETRDGQYSHWLLQAADIVSDEQESVICPDIEATSTTPVTNTTHTEVPDMAVQVHIGSDGLEPHTVGPTDGSPARLAGSRRLVTDSEFVKNMVMSKRGKLLTPSTTARKQFSLPVPQMASSRATTQVSHTYTSTSTASANPGLTNVHHSGTVRKNSSPKIAVRTQQTFTQSTQKLPTDKMTQRTPHSHQVNQSMTTNGLEGFHQDQAYWALGSLVFLLGLLSGAVYHTKLWRKKMQGEMFKQVETVNYKDWEQAPKEKLSIPGLIRKKFDLLRQKTTRYHLLNQQEVLYNAMFSDVDSDGDSK
ncbi:uncharacterized protein [Branchiostoma lanceolatum]|uniref:uncharacterized protein n=1 Tax=Branchiostoma lanceolatum TaxID=7740 RepID=UPI003456CC40